MAEDLDSPADDASRGGPAQQPDHQRFEGEAAAEQGDDDDGDQELGQDLESLGDAHQHLVEDAAEEAGCHADGHSEPDADGRADQADRQRDATAMEDAGEHVAAEIVGAEEMCPGRFGERVGAHRHRIDGRQQRREQHAADDEQDQQGADRCGQRQAPPTLQPPRRETRRDQSDGLAHRAILGSSSAQAISETMLTTITTAAENMKTPVSKGKSRR